MRESIKQHLVPIIPIQKPINKEIVPGTLKDDIPFNKPEDSQEIEEFNEFVRMKIGEKSKAS